LAVQTSANLLAAVLLSLEGIMARGIPEHMAVSPGSNSTGSRSHSLREEPQLQFPEEDGPSLRAPSLKGGLEAECLRARATTSTTLEVRRSSMPFAESRKLLALAHVCSETWELEMR